MAGWSTNLPGVSLWRLACSLCRPFLFDTTCRNGFGAKSAHVIRVGDSYGIHIEDRVLAAYRR